ncbi:MAG: hypothetical protein QXT34_02445 [Candidatus Aenigmatarchaeota archaeon]
MTKKKINAAIMKKGIILAIMLVSIFSLSIAGILDYYAKANVNVNVNPPIFYLDYSDDEYKLKLNEPGSGSITLDASKSKGTTVGFSIDLPNVEWYPANWTIYLNVSSNGGQIEARLFNGNSQICSFTGNSYITVNGSYIISGSYNTNGTVNINNLVVRISCENQPCTIYFGPETRLEVRPLGP